MENSKQEKRRVLVIGAGPVGKVVGAHLSLAGCACAFFAKPEQKASLLEHGVNVLDYGRRAVHRVEEPVVLTQIDELNRSQFDLVFICVRSEQVESVYPLLEKIADETPIVSFQPGFHDSAKLRKRFPQKRILLGHPGFSAFRDGPNVLVRTNRLLSSLISDPKDPINSAMAAQVVAMLRISGLRARVSANLADDVGMLYAAAVVFLLGLEYHGWHFIAFLYDHKLVKLVFDATFEAQRVVRQALDLHPPRWQRFAFRMPRVLIRLVLNIYLASPESPQYRMWAVSGQKIRVQTYQMIREILEMAKTQQIAATHLQKLLTLLENLQKRPKERFAVVK